MNFVKSGILSLMNLKGVLDTKKGNKLGKRLVVMVGTHGNEPCGIEMLKEKLPELTINCGEVVFILGNPRAVEQKIRYTEADLNRMFKDEREYSQEQKAAYEYQRAQELKQILATADALLDIHSSGSKESVPFIIAEPHSFETTSYMPVQVVSYGWDVIEAGGTDYFVNKSGGKGICIECGYHNDPETKNRAWEALRAFLIREGAIFDTVPPKSTQKIIHANYIYHTQENFALAKEFADFESVVVGQLIGHDGQRAVSAPKDGVIIFARNREKPEQEAFIIGEVV